MHLYLASASPRRLELLRQAGYEPQRVAQEALERRLSGETPENMVRRVATDTAAMDKAETVLAQVGLHGKETEPANSLSYGERRALEIGVAIATEPRLLFLDEPTSGLGTEATVRLAELITELKRYYTLVIIEHDMPFLFRLADQISVIHWGQVIASGTPETLRANKWVQASNLGKLA